MKKCKKYKKCKKCNGSGYIKYTNKFYLFFIRMFGFINNNDKFGESCTKCNGTGKKQIMKLKINKKMKIKTLILESASPKFFNNSPRLKINSLILKTISPKRKKENRISYAGW